MESNSYFPWNIAVFIKYIFYLLPLIKIICLRLAATSLLCHSFVIAAIANANDLMI